MPAALSALQLSLPLQRRATVTVHYPKSIWGPLKRLQTAFKYRHCVLDSRYDVQNCANVPAALSALQLSLPLQRRATVTVHEPKSIWGPLKRLQTALQYHHCVLESRFDVKNCANVPAALSTLQLSLPLQRRATVTVHDPKSIWGPLKRLQTAFQYRHCVLDSRFKV